MTNKIDEIRKELSGTTGMTPELEEDLFARIAEIEEISSIVTPMNRKDLYFGILLTVVAAILPIILVGIGVM